MLSSLGKEFGLEGKELLAFVKEQQDVEKQRFNEEREKRQREHESKKLEAQEGDRIRVLELEAKEKKLQIHEKEKEDERRHEFAMKELELQGANADVGSPSNKSAAKLPKLPAFVDGKDDLDSYLQRFERFARSNNWDESTWSTSLSALLAGKALDVYSRLSETAAVDYKQLKEALLKRNELTENGFRKRFRGGKPEDGESPEQFVTRLNRYLTRWVKLSKTEKTYEAICYLLVREQFISSCPDDLAVHLRERNLPNLKELTEVAEQFLVAHEKAFSSSAKPGSNLKLSSEDGDPLASRKESGHGKRIQCFNCKGYGHKASACRKPGRQEHRVEKRCFLCDRTVHYAKDCSAVPKKNGTYKAGAARHDAEIACIQDNQLLLADGTKLPIVKGMVGTRTVNTLRGTGCSRVVVRKKFVNDDQYTGKYCYILLIDNTVRQVPIVKIQVDTPYLKEVEAQCLPDTLYDLIIGNVEGARPPDDPDPDWPEACAVTTRAQAKRDEKLTPLKTPRVAELSVSKEDLSRMQEEDPTLEKFRVMSDTKVRNDYEIPFKVKDGVLYQFYKSTQVCKKTMDKITSNFYWPGIHGDVTRFCRSCDICQRTIQKGKIPKVPVELMPLIDTSFKRVAVDLIGPIHSPSEQGHCYILTLVDYATRYPDAAPLKSISTEAVTEALVDMYSRLGVPEEILSDLGTQFVSECMQVLRLLSIKQLSTTPYHPMCNGLVEKFNGSLKSMLKKLCSEQPKQWHRYINALLFAYREVPQGSTGFSPFELPFGRTVRGPMMILKQLWTEEVEDPEVKTSYAYIFDLRERLEDTVKLAQEELKKSQVRYQRYYNRKAKSRSLKVGSKVLLLLPTDKNKLLLQWKGPFIVELVVGINDYGIRVGDKVKTFHANMLKEYVDRQIIEVKEQDDEHGVQGCSVLQVVATAVIERSESGLEEAVDDENLLELGTIDSKETVEDVTFGQQLNGEQKG